MKLNLNNIELSQKYEIQNKSKAMSRQSLQAATRKNEKCAGESEKSCAKRASKLT